MVDEGCKENLLRCKWTSLTLCFSVFFFFSSTNEKVGEENIHYMQEIEKAKSNWGKSNRVSKPMNLYTFSHPSIQLDANDAIFGTILFQV